MTKLIYHPDDPTLAIGTWKTYKRTGTSGPCLYASVPFQHDGSYRERCLAMISCNESPLVHPSNPGTAAFPLKPGLNSVQAYEPWVSGGMCHAISKKGNYNLQKLLEAVFTADPTIQQFMEERGYALQHQRLCIDPTGTDTFDDSDHSEDLISSLADDSDVVCESDPTAGTMVQENLRTESFCVALWQALGMPGARQPSVEFFWGLIEGGLKSALNDEWREAALADERLHGILSSLVINAGAGPRSLTRAILKRASSKTAEAVTKARIAVYGPGFGTTRAQRELESDYLVDGQPVVL